MMQMVTTFETGVKGFLTPFQHGVDVCQDNQHSQHGHGAIVVTYRR